MFFQTNSKFKKKYHTKILITSFIFFGGAVYLHTLTERPSIEIGKQDSAINIRSDFLTALSFGNKRFYSDIIWIKTLLESDEEHFKGKKFNNWMFLRFKTISDLDPLFYQNYLWGGQFLAIVKDDPEGANFIYERGLKYYPNDYNLNYHAGFNYFYEQENYQKGYEKFSIIKDHPKTTPVLKSIIKKMEFELTFNFDSALEILKEQYASTTDEKIRERLASYIYAVKAERDLICLNSKKFDCELLDAHGFPYQLKDGKYSSLKAFELYRLKKKKDL